ncbi:hypothetical protein SNE40_014658 [Patella caerulea]|uniref:Uncharacterized protein n=1 Tax=Patella caerulea TaxID=87958 RepID=A0AAN8JIF9_PATCE
MIQKGQKADKATAVHSTSTPDVPHSINKTSSLNSNHTVIKNVKRQGLELPSLIVYPKINPGSSATPPKIKSSSSVFENPQKRFKMAKKVGAAPLPSLPGLFNPKPPASPRPDTKNIRLPSLSSQTKFYNRQD